MTIDSHSSSPSTTKSSPPPQSTHPSSTISFSAEEQKLEIWSILKQRTTSDKNTNTKKDWPKYQTILADFQSADYNEITHCPMDLRAPQLVSNKTTTILTKSKNSVKSLSTSMMKTKRISSKGVTSTRTCVSETSVTKTETDWQIPSKTICAHGAACCARVEMFGGNGSTAAAQQHQYSGLFSSEQGKAPEHCILRLSSALKPPALEASFKIGKAALSAVGGNLAKSQLFPCVALKAFRGNGIPSGNLLFAGAKTGQTESDFFAHCVCTSLTEKMASPLKKLVLPKFRQYSDYPLSLGLSDWARHDQHGIGVMGGTSAAASVDWEEDGGGSSFPYCLILRPVWTTTSTDNNKISSSSKAVTFSSYLDQLLSIPPNSILYDIFACPTPAAALDPARIQRVGRIVSTSEMIPSTPNDGLFFKHQIKEEDFCIRPDFETEAKENCTVEGEVGTIAEFTGWKIFESHIAEKKFVDYENIT